ncbi:MAG: hypothetical protein ABRQ39_21680 [Candidatus Eremiobacterota bacterium]
MDEKLSKEQIQRRVTRALERLIDLDDYLLEHNVYEISITHKLAEYLQQEFPYWTVDCEYDKNYKEEVLTNGPKKQYVLKQINDCRENSHSEASIYPDIIIHHRGTKENLLIIEVKKALRGKTKEKLNITELSNEYKTTVKKLGDIYKLGEYKREIGYEHILFIELWVNKKDTKKEYDNLIKNGEKPYELYFNDDILSDKI